MAKENAGVFELERSAGAVQVRQALPFLFMRDNVNDFQRELGEAGQAIERDYEAMFSHNF